MANKSSIPGARPTFAKQNQRTTYLPTLQNANAATAHLRRVLNVMFPPAYIKLFHQPPQSVCSLFSLKLSSLLFATSLNSSDSRRRQSLDDDKPQLEPSSEPSSRAHIVQLQDLLQESLVEHQAKPVGLCPIRRAIYDQCFDELIRQVTVGCVEQGLLLFRIRNELRMTISCYRRAYESAVRYGLNKALDASLKLARMERLEPEAKSKERRESSSLERTDPESKGTNNGGRLKDLELKLKDYYEGELTKSNEIIAQQRAVIKALNQGR